MNRYPMAWTTRPLSDIESPNSRGSEVDGICILHFPSDSAVAKLAAPVGVASRTATPGVATPESAIRLPEPKPTETRSGGAWYPDGGVAVGEAAFAAGTPDGRQAEAISAQPSPATKSGATCNLSSSIRVSNRNRRTPKRAKARFFSWSGGNVERFQAAELRLRVLRLIKRGCSRVHVSRRVAWGDS